jgi:hypothetical protein
MKVEQQNKLSEELRVLAEKTEQLAATLRRTDQNKFFSPAQVAKQWGYHTGSVRRLIRRGQIESVIISRRRLIPIAEIEKVEAQGQVKRNAQ